MSNNLVELQEPEGISFYSIRTGEIHYGKLEPTIAAYINSSDMGINASRGQDYGWRLSPEWVAKVRAFRRNPTQMAILTAKNGGQKPTVVQILYYMYGEQLQAFFEAQEDNENPYEEAYAQAISKGGVAPEQVPSGPQLPAALADFREASEDEDGEDISDLVDEVMTEGDESTAPETQVEPKKDASAKSAKAK